MADGNALEGIRKTTDVCMRAARDVDADARSNVTSSMTDARRGARSERPPRAVTAGPVTRDTSSATEAGTRARALRADSFSKYIGRHGVRQRKLFVNR